MSDTAKILLVDDEPGVRESVTAFLEFGEEFSVKSASNAKEAWDLLQQETPNLIISDIMMPEVNGYQFLEKVRNDPRYQSLPFIFLTARGMTSDRIQGYNAGCDAYLSKPFDPDELESLIKNLLKRRQITESSQGDDRKLDEIYQELLDIKEKMGNPGGLNPTPPPFKIDLTPREQSVLDLVAEGLMNKEIASRLNTSVRNVEKYVSRLFSKTGTNSRTELVRFALKHGLTQ